MCIRDSNEREWFLAHKADYEDHVRAPFQQLLTDLQPAVAAISPHYRSDPKTVGGSMFRIQRDTRFASDKTPYKPWQGARIFHERRKQVAAPSFYLHLQPGASFIGAGPVSYTHLDVYKRQAGACTARPCWWATQHMRWCPFTGRA